MKNLLTAVLCALCIGFFSCQKEVGDIFKTNGSSGSATKLLKRTVLHKGQDSSVTDYFYNNSGKLIAVNTKIDSSGSIETNDQNIERNSQGFIQRIITKASQFSQLGIDSLVINVRSSGGKYLNRVWKINFFGLSFGDSTAFYYDASGKITAQKDYLDDGIGDIDSSRIDYLYIGTNLSALKGYDLNSGSSTPDLTQVFEYDSKPSPLVVGNEGFILNNFYQWVSANNLIKVTVNVAGDPDTHIQTWNYIYNSANKPLSANIVQDGQAGITNVYYYD